MSQCDHTTAIAFTLTLLLTKTNELVTCLAIKNRRLGNLTLKLNIAFLASLS